MRQEFGSKDPIVYLQLVSTYLTSFYGSNLWDLYGETANRFYKSWNIMVRYMFDIPRETHKYLIEPISQTTHLNIKLIKRFINFSKMLSKCQKPRIKFLQKIQKSDYRSTFGRNYQNVCKEAEAEDIELVDLSLITYEPIPLVEQWRPSVILELLEIRSGRLTTDLSSEEIGILINTICKS